MPTESNTYADLFRKVFEKAKGLIEDSSYRVFENADDSVDGWFMVSTKIGESIRGMLTDIQNALKAVPGSFISIGFRLPPSKSLSKEVIDKYNRYMGLIETFTYPRKNSRHRGYPLSFTTAKQVWKYMKNNGHRKPEQIVVKYHFNPQYKKPKREDM